MSVALKRTAAAAAVSLTLFVLGTQVGLGQQPNGASAGSSLPSAFAGSAVSGAMDDADRLSLTRAMDTLATGDQTSWRNSQSGNNYTVKASRWFSGDSGGCREFDVIGELKAGKETAHGTACKRGDGTWNLQARTTAARSGQ